MYKDKCHTILHYLALSVVFNYNFKTAVFGCFAIKSFQALNLKVCVV